MQQNGLLIIPVSSTCFGKCYKYITLYKKFERCRVGNIQQSWACSLEAVGRKEVIKVHPCTGTEALYRPYGP